MWRVTAMRQLFSSSVDDVEVVLPRFAIKRFLPVGHDGVVILAELTFKALGEVRGVAPQLPPSIAEAHLVDPRHTAIIEVQGLVIGARFVSADHPPCQRRTRWWRLTLAHKEEGSVFDPFEADVSEDFVIGIGEE